MIAIGPGNIVISTLYGEDGHRELRAVMKKHRLGREFIRSEGHPADEHLVVPESKRGSILGYAVVVTAEGLQSHQSTKRIEQAQRVAKGPSTSAVRSDRADDMSNGPRQRQGNPYRAQRLLKEVA